MYKFVLKKGRRIEKRDYGEKRAKYINKIFKAGNIADTDIVCV